MVAKRQHTRLKKNSPPCENCRDDLRSAQFGALGQLREERERQHFLARALGNREITRLVSSDP